MLPEVVYQIGFITLAVLVLGMILAGSVLWVRWAMGRRSFNVVGEASGTLITRDPQPIPKWSLSEFFLMFGTMIMVASLLSPGKHATPQAAVDSKAPANATSADPPSDASPTNEAPTDPTDPTEQAAVESTPPPQPHADESPAMVQSPPKPTAKDASERLQISFIANLIALLVTVGYIISVHGASLKHLTLIPTRRDIRRGLIATLWILAPVLIINVIASSLVRYEHAVTDLLAQHNDFATFAFLFLSAAVLTPVVEEFLFRLLLQGGLQKIADLPTGVSRASNAADARWSPHSLWPILVASFVFALMHLGQGAAPIPLFVLAVGLGLLYQRTGRLFPCIVIHMLLNGATLLMEYCRLNSGLDALAI